MSKTVSLMVFLASFPSFAGQVGLASWYGNESGSITANGEKFIPSLMTAAHRSLPFNTMAVVTHLSSGKTVVVRINDRGPAKWTNRVIDLSRGAAEKLGIIKQGVAKVRIEIIR